MNVSVPIINLPFKYANGLEISVASNTTLAITDGQCRDSTNVTDILVKTDSLSTTIDATTTGLNGLDTGSLAASTWYSVFAIADSSFNGPSGFLMSTSSSAPTMPFNYDAFRHIGWIRTDGSSHFLPVLINGKDSTRQYRWYSKISVLSGGSSATFAAIDLSGAVPPVNKVLVNLNAAYTPAVAGNVASLRPSGLSTSSDLNISSIVVSKAQDLEVSMNALIVSNVPKIDYVVQASDALTLSVLGFTIYL